MFTAALLPIAILGFVRADLSVTEKAETIQAFSKELERSYVHVDVAKRITAELAKWQSTDDYRATMDGKQFADKVNKIMAGQVTDGHLWLGYSEVALPTREKPMKPGKEEIERTRKMVRLTNAGFRKVERLTGNIGYIKIDEFASLKESLRPMESAIKFLGNTDAMIVDLRDHRGGYSETCDRFASYFFDAKKPVKFSDLFDRSTGKTIEVWSDKNTGGIRYSKPLYVLVNKMTASAGEAPAYALQAYKRSITIGEPTYGIANMGNFFRVNDHFNSFIPYAQGRNPVTGTNWEKTGVVPEVKVPSATALQRAHTLALEKLIETASDEDKKMLSMALDRVKA